jgi:hypothetical protein
MKQKKTFHSIIEQNTKQGKPPDDDVFGSREWYRQKAISIRSEKNKRPERFLKMGRERKKLKRTIKGRLMMGRMYMFTYEPKMYETLPYYDRFPIIFALESHNDGILGINLHYLPHVQRAFLMDNLYDLRTDTKMNEQTRLLTSYKFLKRTAKYRYFRPCIKKYLDTRVTSRFMQIDPNEWEVALFLPLERFKTGRGRPIQRRTVWQDTRNKLRFGRGKH